MNFIDKRRGFFMIENDAIDNCNLDVYEFKAYAVIVRHANRDTQSAFPSLTTLTEKVGCGRKKIVQCIKSLEEKGYIQKVNRKDDQGNNLSNIYYVLPTPSVSQKLVVSEGNQGSIPEKLGVVSEGNTNNTNLNNTNLTISSSKNPFSFYESNIGVLNPFMADGIDQWIKDTSEELVIAAMERALKQQKKWNYAEGILKQWANKNIKTLSDVEALEAEYQRNKGAKNNAESGGSNTNRYSQKGEYDYGF
ncbi:DnaD domain protein (plasmid) [Bacillus cereus]|uniref:DnaD domain protein n=1 Tax=Bacillus TaxID=1386 RepID=UPI000B538919|nr:MULTISPECIES: DnaD domain protein [Bacillus]MBE3645706.1 DnaD domain protein [Bacillus anthracis]MDA2038518.1 DnaD domain protein [Bacillus cereus]MDA2055029.1 DnaD domain protein [Bacillus cereus]OWW09749.1 DNA replication protein [Bacillus sp. MB353a]QUW34495.1 DnaD domain protein [Bacillus cereus]